MPRLKLDKVRGALADVEKVLGQVQAAIEDDDLEAVKEALDTYLEDAEDEDDD